MVRGERQKNKRYRPGSRRQNWKNFDLFVFPGSPYQDSLYRLSQLILFSTDHNCQKGDDHDDPSKHSKYFVSNIHHICQKGGSHDDPAPTAVWRRRKHDCFLCVVLGSSDLLDFNSFDILILPSEPINIFR